MAFSRLSASAVLASMIFLLYWTTSSARSHDLSAPHRVRRDMPSGTREKVSASVTMLKESLAVVKDVVGKSNTRTVSAVIKSIANLASLAPGITGLVSSFLNLVLIFIPQDNPLTELRAGFAEVNKKLDSLSVQISNLATDVEWFNYASVYSQDEVRILNAWKKFNEFRENSELTESEDNNLRLAEVFTKYYENTATEASVANLYHYLTVSDMSLSGNLNLLLRKKFKCDVREIGRYNLYFSSLLWKGMLLNQLYWKLIGLQQTGINAQYTKMFKNVSSAQISAIEFCVNNYQQYLQKDVEEIGKALDPSNKRVVAEEVKNFLDKKYYWYYWVVLVFNSDTDQDYYHVFFSEVIKAEANPITIAVSYVDKEGETYRDEVIKAVKHCNPMKTPPFGPFLAPDFTPCKIILQQIQDCNILVHGVPLREYVKSTYATNDNDWLEAPDSLMYLQCKSSRNLYSMSIFYSRTVDPCPANQCERGECKRLGKSSEHLCECPDNYYGDRCETELESKDIPAINAGRMVPDITAISAKLKAMETKLDAILNNTCPAL
ncbi:uncharacterized protein LOC121938160 [Plectropomus leopardus]|uniref:uncharacterized protein LOC121938160 n=1 Tax=Plectropomus leopardus TaxID=160734 RepID=UPI001C4CF700|nr:uncharacterized protein LOC121938160 [Plectropomus leopardus]XP_042337373.1 uncharacterized protein LOC121938160 [Plectropomus leopardus]